MYGDWSSLVVAWLGIVLSGVTIKLMDDWLDVEYDKSVGRTTLAVRLGRAVLPYGLLCLALAMALASKLALTLFIAAYAIGMGHDLREKMPTRLPGWIESLVALGLAAIYAGWQLASWALFVMLMIQLLDDLMDLQQDRRSGQNNWAQRFGTVEATLAMFICALVAVLLMPMETAMVFGALPVVHVVMSLAGGLRIRRAERREPQ